MHPEQTAADDSNLAPRRRLTSALAVGIWVLAALSLAGKLVYLLPVKTYRNGAGAAASLQASDVLEPVFILAMASLGTFIVLRAANRRIGWLALATATSLAIVSFAAEFAQFALLVAPEANLPLGRFAGWVQDLWPIPFVLVFCLPFLFPNGRLPSSRWRTIFWLQTAGWSLFILVLTFAQRPMTNAFLAYNTAPPNPTGIIPMSPTFYTIPFAALFGISVVTGIASLISRWRRTGGEVRQQIKWVVYAFLMMLIMLAASWVNTILTEALGVDLGLESAVDAAVSLSLLGVIAALGIAVLKYRLYDIDLIINRTLVYVALTAAIIATYVSFVAGVGALLPLEDNLFLSLLATGVVAVLFNPLRVRLQRFVNRLMFGRRDDPYAVLSELGRHLSSSAAPDATLQTVVDSVATALKLPYAAIQLEQQGAYRTQAEYRAAGGHRATAGQVALPLVHQNEVVGRLVVAPRSPGEALTPKDRQLLEDVAHQAGAVAYSVRLTAALQHSREMLVLAREEERRRIRRDLHDGLGPSLASQTFKLDAALDLLQNDPQSVAQLLESLKRQNQRLVADIRRLVYQLRPPALDELGLSGALEAHVGQINSPSAPHISITIRPEPLPALPAAVEVAAYRLALEGITNVVRHARARECTVTLEAGDSRLVLTIDDDGVGLPSEMTPGVGLTSMRERAEEVGGSFEIAAGPDGGTQMRAVFPTDGSGHDRLPTGPEELPVQTGIVDGGLYG